MKTVKELLHAKGMANAQVTTVTPDQKVYEAVEILGGGNFGALPVVESGKLVGILSERDYTRKVVLKGRTSRDTFIKEIMTPNPFFVGPESPVEECMQMMLEKKFRHLPVIENEELIGVLSIKDALSAVISDQERLIDEAISLSEQKQEELIRNSGSSVREMIEEVKTTLGPVSEKLAQLNEESSGAYEKTIYEVLQSLNNIEESTKPVSRLLDKEGAMGSTRVLLACSDRNEEVTTKLALGGTGVQVDVTKDSEDGKEKLQKQKYSILCVNRQFVELANFARQADQNIKIVFMTSETPEKYLSTLLDYPSISNIVSSNEGDRTFFIKSVSTTVGKLANDDYFGMEKYLSWGVDIHEHPITGSSCRTELIDQMSAYLKEMGVRRTLVGRCVNVAEEILMNAIYDAPVDSDGKPLYNHLDRTVPIHLERDHQGRFRYACDGMFIAISAEDPFGALNRGTILRYLKNCYSGDGGSHNGEEKGGGGHGIYIITQSASLIVFNVKEGSRTEVIALFDLEPKTNQGPRTSSLHYFYA